MYSHRNEFPQEFGSFAENDSSRIFSCIRSIGASQMTTKFLTIKFEEFPNFIVMEFSRKSSVFGQFSVNFPLLNPLQNANFINIVVSASLTLVRIQAPHVFEPKLIPQEIFLACIGFVPGGKCTEHIGT